MPTSGLRARLSYIGHATVLVELDGIGVLTDPILRSRVGPLRRQTAPAAPAAARAPDAVLVSHLHRDHTDLPSLRRLGQATHLVVPRGTGRFFARHGFTEVEELAPGQAAQVGPVAVTAIRAIHDGGRAPFRSGPAIGFLLAGSKRIYFAGDTDVFEAMRELNRPDLALLPIWGWGPSLGPGHMDPTRAAEAVELIRPKVVVPIHWGTFYPRFLEHLRPGPLSRPPEEFVRALEDAGSEADLRVLISGASLDIP